jgi:hypothetical protein
MYTFRRSGLGRAQVSRRRARLSVNSLEVRVLPAIFTVTNTLDNGLGSLRQALIDANSLAGTDSIIFDTSVFNKLQTITLASGNLLISDNVRVAGPGANLLTISGNNISQVIQLRGTKLLDVSISGLTITKGNSKYSAGGIAAYSCNLTIQSCVITSNKGGAGAGCLGYDDLGSGIPAGLLTVIDSQVTNNAATYRGGGIWTHGGLVLQRSTISGNMSNDFGGGAFVVSRGLAMDSSIVASNRSNINGGGLYVTETSASVRNSIVSQNVAAQSGGGVAFVHVSANTIQNTTISANSSGTGRGGGIFAPDGSLSVTNSIVSGNSNSQVSDVYFKGLVNAAFSAIGTSAGMTTFNADSTTVALLGLNPLLGPLANYGGPTLTMALLPGSPCIDAGSVIAGVTTDQRGYLRSYSSAPDIGAYELQPPRVASVVINDGSAQRSRVTSVTVNFDSLVTLQGLPDDAFRLQRQSDGQLVSLSAFVVNSATTSVIFTFTGALSEFGSLQDGRYTLTAFDGQVSNFVGGLDGNGDGVPGDNYVLASSGTAGVFRLFGDANGDGAVGTNDFVQFRLALFSPNSIFDFNGDGWVAASDFLQFRSRFGVSI